MRKVIVLLVCMLFATSLIMVSGCAEKKQEPVKPATEAVKPAEPAKSAEPEKKPEEAKPAEKAPEKK